MKRSKTIKYLFSLLLMIALVTGCKEYLKYTITTRILPDGSIERTMLVEGGDSSLLEGDFSSVLKGSLPVPHDSTWEISTGCEIKSTSDTTKDTVYYCKAIKVFRNSDELNKELNWDSTGENKVVRHVKVEKRFRWFNTFYRYAETYKQIFPFKRKPITDYLSNDELELYHADDNELYYSPETDELLLKKDTLARNALSKTDSARMDKIKKSIQEKYDAWVFENIFEDYFDVLKVALDKSGTMKPVETDKTRDSLWALFNYSDKIDSLLTSDSSDFPLLRFASKFYKVDTGVLHQANRSGFDDFNWRLNNTGDVGESFTNLTIMPGVIISTNSTTINGNTASWEFDGDSFNEKDFTLLVESRKVNKGPVIVTGAFVLLLLIGLVAGMVRKK
jgi:hypothetical protein